MDQRQVLDRSAAFLRRVTRFAIWLSELIAQSLLVVIILFVMLEPQGNSGPSDILKLCLVVLLYFGFAGYAVTTALSRLFWDGSHVSTYPLFAAFLFFVHFEFPNYVFGGDLLTPTRRLVFVIAGMCGTFLTALPGSFALKRCEIKL